MWVLQFTMMAILSILCSVFFWLWNSGGPNYRKEFELYQKEQESSWTKVNHSKKKSYAQAVQTPRFINNLSNSSGSSIPSGNNSIHSVHLNQARNQEQFQN